MAGYAMTSAGGLNGDGTTDLIIVAPGTGQRANVLYTPASWSPDPTVYGTAGADAIAAGDGGPFHAVGDGEAARILVRFTDALFHVAGDGASGGIVTPTDGDGVINGGGLCEDCPMVDQVRAALESAGIIPIFAMASGFETTCQGLVTDLGRGAVVTLTANNSNIVDAISAGMMAATHTALDHARAGSGDDTMLGGVENNSLAGNFGNDSLDGRSGADTLLGGAGDDALTGGCGHDVCGQSGLCHHRIRAVQRHRGRASAECQCVAGRLARRS